MSPFIIRRLAGVPDFLTSEDMLSMVSDDRIDPKMVFSYVQEVLQRITISPQKETKATIDLICLDKIIIYITYHYIRTEQFQHLVYTLFDN